ncbi:fibronectin type III domain-containing protein [Bacillus sp. ISL-40]|uniref:cytochrome c3 family protein n=1 Tax=unclassified Bacillus (in: firmicutes) TaxID=185979 RepID=UPI001BEAD96B|nr:MULTISPECIES: cytochrome c3 family protein [unclassified Bacillus (in: firmicutes)]MBT2698192.1 fibronectin type III domain-containing protein [Bacillus sp. ISL-40]MBT2741986.1 fibronectin type III domain-containing protein [Bacillus sp. ISL-77]
MSKGRLGFSFLTAIAFMLMFSISAMAAIAGVVNLKATVDNDGAMKATWSADTATGVTGYTVTVTKKADGSVVDTKTATATTYTLANLDTKTVYNVEVKTNGGVNDTATSTITDVKYRYNNKITSTDKDNGLENANKTGKDVTINNGTKVGEVIKSKDMVKNDGSTGNHRTHGEYQNNTNSCASCHQTHTGASKSLLFKDGVYNTCTACHDGTLGFYNVFEPSNAGTFGGTHTGNMSVHLADGSVQIKAAPGGNGAANNGSWVNEFNCASCHSPHGSYSDRLLHYNPNGMGLATKAEGGIGYKGQAVVNYSTLAPAKGAESPLLVRGTATEMGITGIDGTAKVISLMELVQDPTSKAYSYKQITTPWLYGYVYGSPKNYYTRFYKQVTTDIAKYDTDGKTVLSGQTDGTINMADQLYSEDDGHGGYDYTYIADFHDNELGNSEIVFSKGYIYSTKGYLDDVKTADIGVAYKVDLDLKEIAKFGSQTTGVPIFKSDSNSLMTGTGAFKGAGVKLNQYCAACHTDYLAHSGSASGTFSKAYRHSTDSDSYTCVRCHYAHGTDVTVMMDAHGEKIADLTKDGGEFEGDTAKATDYLLDKNPSSALKRYTNMSVCWGCHTDSKAEQLKNTSSFKDDNDPHGLEAQPVVGTDFSSAGSEVTVTSQLP